MAETAGVYASRTSWAQIQGTEADSEDGYIEAIARRLNVKRARRQTRTDCSDLPVPPRQHAAAAMAVACGDGHTVLVGERGLAVFACGRGGQGQLGCGARHDQRVPARIPELDAVLVSERIVMVAAGEYHSAASTSTGEAAFHTGASR